MGILFYSGVARGGAPIPTLAEEQVVCGPYLEDEQVEGRVFSLRAGRGDCDLRPVVARVPADQLPQALVCLIDAGGEDRPRQLDFLPCVKVLLVTGLAAPGRPFSSLLEYLRTQRFDRIVVLDGRMQARRLCEAGVKNVFWFPGLLFPHSDAFVEGARRQKREPRVVTVGSVWRASPRRLRWIGALAKGRVESEARSVAPLDVLDYFGASTVVLDTAVNDAWPEHAMHAFASGTPLLIDRPTLLATGDFWQDGREVCAFSTGDELCDKARHLLGHPAEAAELGARAARWFDQRFSAKKRRVHFDSLVLNGREVPEFALTPRERRTNWVGSETRAGEALRVFEKLQGMHVEREHVRVIFDPSVPQGIEEMFSSLPRLEVARAAPDEAERAGANADLLAVTREKGFGPEIGSVRRLWIWDARPEDLVEICDAFKAAGFLAPLPGVSYFCHAAAEAQPDPAGERAAALLDRGDSAGAFEAAKNALTADPRSLESCLVLAELAAEAGNQEAMLAKMLALARGLAPDDPRLALFESTTWLAQLRHRPALRLVARARDLLDSRDYQQAWQVARAALQLAGDLAEAHHIEGRAGIVLGRDFGDWANYGKGLQSLRKAAELSPRRIDFQRMLAFARRQAGGTLPQAAPPYRAAIALDPENAAAHFGLGETLMKLGDTAGAVAAMEAAVRCAPRSLGLMRWLGHALKRAGRIEEAHALYIRGYGGRADAMSPRPRGKAGKRRAVFVVQNGHAWPCMASVYAAFAADPAWETIVVGMPWLHPSFQASSRHDQDIVFAFLEEQKIPHVRWEKFPLQEMPADLLFLQNPYDNTRPKGWSVADLVRLGHRLCYVPYSIEFGADRDSLMFQFNYPLQRFAWAVAARTEAHRALFAEHCLAGAEHVIACGHPKFDDLAQADAVRPDPELVAFARGRPLVLWTPHFDVKLNGTRCGSGFSTFLRWYEFVFAEFARRPDLAFVVRPHPTFFSAFEHRGLMTRAELDAMVERAERAGNVRLHCAPDYFPALQAADAMLTDASSLIFEFGVSGKPICYLHNPTGPVAHLAYEIDLDCVRMHCRWATEETHITEWLDRIPQAIRDKEARDRRAAEYRRRMGVSNEPAGVRFKRAIESRLGTKPPEAKITAAVAVDVEAGLIEASAPA